MADLTNAQKKEWAKTLYLKENLTQQEIADRVGVSRVSVSNWVRAGKWEEQKVGLTLTRQGLRSQGRNRWLTSTGRWPK